MRTLKEIRKLIEDVRALGITVEVMRLMPLKVLIKIGDKK